MYRHSKTRTLLLEGGLILLGIFGAYFLGGPLGAIGAGVVGVGLIVAWWYGKEEDEETFEEGSLFGGRIPTLPQPSIVGLTEHDPCIVPRYEKSASAHAGINNSDWFVLSNEGGSEAYDVKLEDFQVGDTILRFQVTALVHSKKWGIATPKFFDVHINTPGDDAGLGPIGITTAFQGASQAWRREVKPAMGAKFQHNTHVRYRDRANNNFRTDFTMIYDTRKDFIEIANVKHSKTQSSGFIAN